MSSDTNRVVYRTCPLCEATCGLEITVSPSNEVLRIRGDQNDVFSKGFICPKGSSLKQLHEDPDRLRMPMVKRNGVHVEVSWDEAWQVVRDGLANVINKHGRDALATYTGNPNAHNLSAMLYTGNVVRAAGTRNRFSAATVDQMPMHVAAGYMFGLPVNIPVPDLDHTDYLLIVGANPYASNGSLCTAPDFPGRIEAIRARGGKVIVVDPRRTRTAQEADEWLAIRPGADGLLLAAIAHVLYEEGLATVGDHLQGHVNGFEELRDALTVFSPDAVAEATGINATTIRIIARELAAASTAAVYGRIGANVVEFGTTQAWLVFVLNTLTGNLDRRGGGMFALPAAGGANTRGSSRMSAESNDPAKVKKGKGFAIGRGTTRVRKLPEVMGEYPAAAMAEEMLTPGDGQVRALITLAGNPVVSTPNAQQLDEAFASLEFMVSVDMYLNETTRHADVILPPPSQLQRDHFDVLLMQFAVRNVANYSTAPLPLDEGQPDEWEVLAKLAGILQSLDVQVDPQKVDDDILMSLITKATEMNSSPLLGRDPSEIFAEVNATGVRGPARRLDVMLQTGPYGAGFGAEPNGLSLQTLLDNPHGVDLGPLQPRLFDILRTESGKVEMAHPILVNDLQRLARTIDAPRDQLLLVGRRHLKTNNSWMHNIRVLTKGNVSCTLQMNPIDAARAGLHTGALAKVTSRVGEVVVPVEVTDDIREGAVSLPHGWGHNVEGTKMRVAAEKAGVNSNVLSDHEAIDPLSGTAVLNAIPVRVCAVTA
jgi:anaerobic selenocysteine-containing dehydrogenase